MKKAIIVKEVFNALYECLEDENCKVKDRQARSTCIPSKKIDDSLANILHMASTLYKKNILSLKQINKIRGIVNLIPLEK